MKKIVDWVTIKFLIVGVINIGSIVSFFLNKYFTFKSGKSLFVAFNYFGQRFLVFRKDYCV